MRRGADLHSVRYHSSLVQRIVRALCCLSVLAAAQPAVAHPAPFSYADLRLQPGLMQGQYRRAHLDVAHDLNISKPDQLLDPARLRRSSRGRLPR